MNPTGKTLRARALAMLARGEYSRAQLQQKLAPYAETEAELTALLDDLGQRLWQSDQRFAELLVHSKGQRFGNRRLRQELTAKGVDEAIIHATVADADAELGRACAVLRKKFKTPATTPADNQRQMRFLAYRGFGMDTIQAALKQAWDETPAD